jgi:hypothetical protein
MKIINILIALASIFFAFVWVSIAFTFDNWTRNSTNPYIIVFMILGFLSLGIISIKDFIRKI